MPDASVLSRRLPVAPLALAGLLLAVQLLVIGLVFKHGIAFRCLDNWPAGACQTASRSLAALYCTIAAGGLFALLRPALFRDLLARAGHDARPLGLNGAGFALAMLPVLFMRQGQGAVLLVPAFAAWTAGMALMLAGIGGWLAPRALWGQFGRRAGATLAVVMAAGAAAPALATRLQPVWQLDGIAGATFGAVRWLVGALGYDVTADPTTRHIGSGDFMISVAPVCSGIGSAVTS